MEKKPKNWDGSSPASNHWDKKQARLNRITKPNGTSQKKRRLNLRRGGK